MKVILKYDDIEVVYEDNLSQTRLEQDEKIIGMMHLKFLSLYELRKKEKEKNLKNEIKKFKSAMTLLRKCEPIDRRC